jgi:hypothetical protein
MLNPDGAERFQRVNAVQIDLNRDAQMLATPEARALLDVHMRFSSAFAFNLHDQSLSSVGESTKVAAVSLLAPPFDARRSVDATRLRALRVTSHMSRALSFLAGGHITRYADDYESRAFGDRMQSWGTSTVLVESGHWPGDPDKAFVRRLNFVGILSCILAIGDGSFEQTELDWYLDREPNGKRLFDELVRGVCVAHAGGWREKVDVAIQYEPRKREDGPTWPVRGVVKAVGDLRLFGGLQERQAQGDPIDVEAVAIERVVDLEEVRRWGAG